MQKKKVYISGPDVFAPNARQLGDSFKIACRDCGFEGLYPLDIDRADITSEIIFTENLNKIRTADIVVANLNPFRGECIDDGTAYEIGFAHALKKPVYGYAKDLRSLRERIGKYDGSGYEVEDFGYPVNLMIAETVSYIVEGDFTDCMRWLRTVM